MKNPFKRKKDKFPTPTAPRDIEAIKSEYSSLAQQAGQVQYEVLVKSKDLEYINSRILAVNQEAAARQRLDKEAAAKPAEESK